MKKLTIGKLQKDLWKQCRRIADILYPPTMWDKTYCFTCDKPIEGKNKQLGHFIPKSVCGAYLKYDMRNLRWQCYNCNINLGGNGSAFAHKLLEKHGQPYIDELFEDKKKIINAYDRYVEQLELYRKME